MARLLPFVGFIPLAGFYVYQGSPETKDNWKHKLNHKFGWQTSIHQEYITNKGEIGYANKCVHCDQIQYPFDPEHPDFRESDIIQYTI